MSSTREREPMWYCHECGVEMRPLMIPDPHCPSCHGQFVEKMENPTDDPRDFQHPHPGLDDDFYPGQDNFILGLSDLLRGTPSGGSGFTLHMNGSQSPGGSTRTFVIGPRPGASGGGGTDRVPPLSDFIRGGPHSDRTPGGGIPPQHAMISHLLSALAQRHSDRQQGFNPFADLLGTHGLGGAGPDSGRWGDYVHNQEALDQIITQLMENSNAHRPVPASEEIIAKLQREVLEEGSPLLHRDCAVCKDQFKVDSEDPDEQVIITLPCKHPYHQSCILPWLNSSGTCPVCRYQLVPQPGSDATPTSQDAGSSSDQRSPPGRAGPQGGGMFNNLFSYLGGSGNTPSSRGNGHSRNQSNSRSTDRRGPPGGWSEELD